VTVKPRPPSKKSPYFPICVVFLFITTGWVGMAGVWEYGAHVLASQGRVATATITKKVMHPAGEEGRTATSYEEDSAFTTGEGKRIEGKTGVAADYWDRIKPGDTFQVTYAANQPSTYQIGTHISTTVADWVSVGILVIWLVAIRLTIRASHRQPTRKAASPLAPDTAADAPRQGNASINGPVFMGVVLSSVGAIFLLLGTVNLVNQGEFRAHGKAAMAIVLTKSTVIGRNGDSYPIGVRFTTDEGKSIETSIGVDFATMTSLREHLPVKIIYAPEHPEQIRLASDDQFNTFVFLWFVSALGGVLAIGGAIVIFSFLYAKHQRRSHA